MNEVPLVEDSLVLAQKIVSCVFRVDQRFGAEYVAQVLIGSSDARIVQKGHDKVSTYGLLSEHSRKSVREWIDQLLGQGVLVKSGEYNVLKITDTGRQVLRGELTPKLRQPQSSPAGTQSRLAADPWEGVDRTLFDGLSELRADLARQREVPVHVVFSDNSIKDMAKKRPSTETAFRLILGVSRQKQADYGDKFLAAIKSHCEAAGAAMDVKPAAASAPTKRKNITEGTLAAFPFFEQGLSIPDVAEKIGKAVSTTAGYLDQYIIHHKVTDPSPWVDAATAKLITAAVEKVGPKPLKPIFVELDEKVPYDQIRVVVSCLEARE